MQTNCTFIKKLYNKNMNTFLALLGVAVIPPLTTFLLPKNKQFFKKDIVRGFGLGVYIALVVLLLKESLEHGGASNTIIWFFIGLVFSICLGLYFICVNENYCD